MAYYFFEALSPGNREEIIRKAIEAIRPMKPDAIAVRGMSGMAIGNIVANELGLPLILVRKKIDLENSHCGGMVTIGVNYSLPAIYNYVIVDDFISTGTTVENIIAEINRYCESNCLNPQIGHKMECIGFYGYMPSWHDNDCARICGKIGVDYIPQWED